MISTSQNVMQPNNQRQQNDRRHNKLQIKLPTLKQASNNGLIISFELPRLKTEKVVPQRSPCYFPKLPKIDPVKKVVNHGATNEKEKLAKIDVLTNTTLPEKRSLLKRCDRNACNLQPRWFRVYPMLLTHPKLEIAKKIAKVPNSTEDSTNPLNKSTVNETQSSEDFKGNDFESITENTTAEGMLKTGTLKTEITMTPMHSDQIKQLLEKGCQRKGFQKVAKDADFEHKSVSLVDYKNQKLNRMVELANRAALRSNYLSAVETLSQTYKYRLPKEKRQKLLGPKENGINEQQFVKCVSKYVRQKKMGYHF